MEQRSYPRLPASSIRPVRRTNGGGMSVTISGKQLSLLLFVSFMLGVGVGYKLKTLRVHYLKQRRDWLASRLATAQQKLDGELRH